MKLTNKQSDRQFKSVPAGTHTAILYSVVDLGTHLNTLSNPPKQQRKVRLTWELPDERTDDDRPMVIGKTYTASSNEKATLAQHLKAWRGHEIPDGYDLSLLLGLGCNLSVVEKAKDNGDTYAAVAGISALKKNEVVPPVFNSLVNFSLDDGEFSEAAFNGLPEFLKEEVMKSPEYAEVKGFSRPASGPAAEEDGLPGHVTQEINY